jgi:RNA polymerase sigma-70 factor (ECF subfamily)
MDPSREMRRSADLVELDAARGRFRRRRTLDRSREAEALVMRAVMRAKEGDADAIRLLYLRYVDNVYGYVCSIVRDEHDAEDVTQQVFAKLMAALARYEPRVVPFSAWILRVAHNAAIDHVRGRRPIPVEEVRSVDEADDGVARERWQDLQDVLRALPEDQREVLMLRFLVGLSPGEVAARLGRSEDAVNALQLRARRRVRTELTQAGAAPAALAA